MIKELKKNIIKLRRYLPKWGGLLGLLLLTACSKEVGPTDIIVEDSSRHYFPVVQGEILNMSFTLTNAGADPFVIVEVQASCACIEQSNYRGTMIRPGQSSVFNFKFDSSKNTGYVNHDIRIYGNVKPDGFVILNFDTDVVPPSANTPDYEELVKDKKEHMDKLEGEQYERSYYTDEEMIDTI